MPPTEEEVIASITAQLPEYTQVYGFAPYLFMGGQPDPNNVEPVDEFVQLDLIGDFLDKPLFKDISTFPG